MGESVMLNLTLSTMFQDPKTTLVGLAFRADLTRIRTQLPKTTFANEVENYLDLATYYTALHEYALKQ
jgi:hypothetical protein